jgi:hypothetical protein
MPLYFKRKLKDGLKLFRANGYQVGGRATASKSWVKMKVTKQQTLNQQPSWLKLVTKYHLSMNNKSWHDSAMLAPPASQRGCGGGRNTI